jgi:hypothetical protein
LLDLVVSKIPELEKYRAELAELTPYATEYRYPGKVADQEDAKVCVEAIRKFRDYLRSILNISIT